MARRPALAVALAFLVLSACRAQAHTGDPAIETVITAIRPVLPGVRITLEQNVVPALAIENRSARALEVLDDRGTPFLRITRSAAEGNLSSPSLYRSAAPGGEASVPPDLLRGRHATHYVILARRGEWGFYDTRIPDIESVAPAIRAAAAPSVLARFSIPLRYGERPAKLQGEVDYVPTRGGPVSRLTSPPHPAPGLTVALLPGRFPAIFVANQSGQILTVLGDDGKTFAEIGAGGVRVNLRSPIYLADARVRGQAPLPTGAGTGPELRLVSPSSSFDWYDPRARLQTRWRIPLRLGARTLAISGTVGFAPAARAALSARGRRGGLPTAAILAGAAVLAALVGARVIRTRRQ